MSINKFKERNAQGTYDRCSFLDFVLYLILRENRETTHTAAYNTPHEVRDRDGGKYLVNLQKYTIICLFPPV